MYEGTRYGPPQHPQGTVRGPDAYTRPTDGEIKAPPAAGVHVVGWIGFFCRLPVARGFGQRRWRGTITFLEREGVTRDGADARMFDANSDSADERAFAAHASKLVSARGVWQKPKYPRNPRRYSARSLKQPSRRR